MDTERFEDLGPMAQRALVEAEREALRKAIPDGLVGAARPTVAERAFALAEKLDRLSPRDGAALRVRWQALCGALDDWERQS